MGIEVKKCTIVSGAPNDNIEFLQKNIDKSTFVIGADSGYQKLIKAGIIPNLIMGDFDSSPYPDVETEIISLPKEKDFTDTFYCVREAVKRGFNSIDIYFAIGNRFDHTYSNVLCLNYCKENNVKCRIIDEHNRLSLISGHYSFRKEYDNFSLFAYLEDCIGVSIKGAYYTAGFFNLDKLDIKQSDQFAQSNFVSDDVCEITVDSGTLLLVESND
jgi:thiamine pyrophosphokinase